MNREDLTNKIMKGIKSSFNNSLNESKTFDPKNNKQHREAYNSFVKWYNRWKEKLGREEIRGLVKKVTNDALGDNLDRINEAYKMPNPIVNTYTGPLPKVDSDDNTIYDEETGETIATVGEYGIVKFKPGLSLQDKLNYRDAILKNRTLKSWFNIGKASFICYQPELFESLNESGIPGPKDDHLAFDLYLTFANTRKLKEMAIPMIDNLLRRLRKGEELSQEILANSSIVEKYAKATIDEYRKNVDDSRLFVSPGTRKAFKWQIAELLIRDAQDDYAFELHDMESNLHN